MREIKYRAYTPKHPNKLMGVTSIDFETQEVELKWKYSNQFDSVDIVEPIEDVKLMQYTGLKDKNGVEIYEGDIVSAIWDKDCEEYIANEEWVVEVFFNAGSYDIDGEWVVALNCFNGTIEIIGNVYENIELLGGDNV